MVARSIVAVQTRLETTGRDQEIENLQRIIREVVEAGAPMMEWRFWPNFCWDERVGYYSTEGRGGPLQGFQLTTG